MSLDQTQNFVRATIASAVDSADTTIDVTDSNQLPDPADGEYNLILWDVDTYPRPGQDPSVEVVRATALDESADELSVDRGQENTAAADHPETAVLQLSPTAKMFADIDAKTSALSEDGQTFAGESVDVESTDTDGLRVDDTYYWASDFDGVDADDRLDNALTETSAGDRIYLEDAAYTDDRTISGSGRVLIGIDGDFDDSGSYIDGTWTVNSRNAIRYVGLPSGSEMKLDALCTYEGPVRGSSNGDVTVIGDEVLVTNLKRAAVTFESGTQDGLVDSSVSTSVTDNGQNTVGDIT